MKTDIDGGEKRPINVNALSVVPQRTKIHICLNIFYFKYHRKITATIKKALQDKGYKEKTHTNS